MREQVVYPGQSSCQRPLLLKWCEHSQGWARTTKPPRISLQLYWWLFRVLFEDPLTDLRPFSDQPCGTEVRMWFCQSIEPNQERMQLYLSNLRPICHSLQLRHRRKGSRNCCLHLRLYTRRVWWWAYLNNDEGRGWGRYTVASYSIWDLWPIDH